MKRFVSVLLFVLMILSLSGCMSVKVPGNLHAKAAVVAPEAVASATQAPEEGFDDAPADEPAAASEVAPVDEPAAASEVAPVDEPAEAVAEEPAEAAVEEPADGSFGAAVVAAVEKLSQVQSLRMDMKLNVAMDIALLACRMDLMRDPFLAKVDVSFSAMGEDLSAQLYAASEGDTATLYLSSDNGETWEKQTSPTLGELPQAPADTLSLFGDVDAVDMQLSGTEEINGRPALVYSGALDGEVLKDFLYSTGILGALSSVMGVEVPEESLLDLGDADVTLSFDAESGLPVRYTVDMTEVVTNLIEALLDQSLAGQAGDGMSLSLDIPAVILDITLSQFDSVEPIVIPEAALAANN